MLVLHLLLLVGQTLAGTRGDGRCGPNFPADDGQPAQCEYIEPFPTCCMENEHCGWNCDDGKYFFSFLRFGSKW